MTVPFLRKGLNLLTSVLGLILLCWSLALGQTTFGSVVGTVTDPTGAIIPGGQVTLINLDTNVKQTTTVNTAGIYEFVNVLPGNYRIDAEKKGFKHFTRQPVVVQIQQAYKIDIEMQLGTVSQSVEVTAATPLVETQTSSLGHVIAGRSVGELPLNGRNVFNLMALVPSVVPQGQSVGTPTGANPFAWNNYQVNGAFGNQSAIYVDGVPLGSGYINLPSYIPTQDSVQEFKVQTDNMGPEWGRFAGGVMNLTTKSGANQFRGEAYEYLRNKVLNANNFFNNRAGIPVGAFTQNQFGVDGGGPISIPGVYDGRNKAFWFASWESFRLRQGQTFVQSVPTDAMRRGDFSNFTPIYDPLTVCGALGNPPCAADSSGNPIYTRQQFAGNIIPSTRINSTSALLRDLWPKPNTAGDAFTSANNFITNASVGGNNNELTTRVDKTLSEKQRVYGRYTYWNNLNLPIDPFQNGVCQDRCTEKFWVHDIVLDDTYSFSPTLISDFHVGFDRFGYDRTVPKQNFDLTTIGWPASLNAQIPSLLRTPPTPNVQAMSDGLFGSQGFGSVIIARTNDWVVSGDLTKIRGRHTMKAGGQLIVLQNNYAQTNVASGIFTFDRGFTSSSPFGGSGGFGFASYLLGFPSGGNNTLPALVAGQQIYRGFYFGDSWQATDRLTLNFGLRYEQDAPWSERFDRESLWDLTSINPLTQSTSLPAKGELCLVATPCHPSRTNLNLDKTQFGPRLGFAYRFTENTVFRGGYGIFWIPINVYWFSPNTDTVNGFSTPFVSSIDGGITPFNNFGNPFPNGLLLPPGRDPSFQSLFLGQGVTARVSNNPYPYAQQWNFDIQRQLPKNFFVDVAYAGSKGTHLAGNGRTQQIDQLPDSLLSLGTALQNQVLNPYFGLVRIGTLSNPTVAQGQLLRPYPQYNGLSLYGAGFGDSIYHSMQLKVQRQFKGGGTLLAAYTVAKLITDVDTVSGWLEGATGGVAGIQNWNNIKGSRSLSSQDVPQRLVVSYVLNLPFGHGHKFGSGIEGPVGKLISGWGVDGITTFQSGFPLKLGTSRNLTNSFGGGSRPNVVAGCNPVISSRAESRLDQWFNTSCFSQPAAFTFGNEARADPRLRMDRMRNHDFAVFKNTSFGPNERLGVQVRTEFFNLFNTPQFGPPGQTQGVTTSFGVVSSQANNPRLIQFALKFLF